MRLGLLPKQRMALTSEADEILYGGAAGPGKSHLLRLTAIAYCSAIPEIQVYLFRRLQPDLAKNHLEGPTGFRAMLATLEAAGKVKINDHLNVIKFANGAKIHLSHCQHEKDKYKYQGPEIHVLLIDELTHFSESIYRYLRARVRAPESLKIPDWFKFPVPRVMSGTNPGNVGHNWVRRTFVKPRPAMEVWRTPEDEGGMLRQFIPGFLHENPFLDQSYAKQLAGLGDPETVKAMLKGDWDIVAGGMIDDLWDEAIHVIPNFRPPKSWSVRRSFDWGSSRPFSVGWWAEANGESVMIDGRERHFAPGTKIRLFEWYGADPKRENTGLKMLAKDIAKKIVEIEAALPFKVDPGPADSAIFATENGMCIADDMATEGVYWVKADKSPGSRVNGAEKVRSMLKASLSYPMEDPGLFVTEACRDFISIIPVLPRDDKKTDDVDTDAEDHIWDEMRYEVQTPNYTITQGEATTA